MDRTLPGWCASTVPQSVRTGNDDQRFLALVAQHLTGKCDAVAVTLRLFGGTRCAQGARWLRPKPRGWSGTRRGGLRSWHRERRRFSVETSPAPLCAVDWGRPGRALILRPVADAPRLGRHQGRDGALRVRLSGAPTAHVHHRGQSRHRPPDGAEVERRETALRPSGFGPRQQRRA